MAVARVAWISASLAERNVVDSLPRTAWSRAPIRSPSPRHREHPRRTPVIGDWLPGPANGSGTQRYIHVLSPGAWALPGDTWQTFVFLWSRLRPFCIVLCFRWKKSKCFAFSFKISFGWKSLVDPPEKEKKPKETDKKRYRWCFCGLKYLRVGSTIADVPNYWQLQWQITPNTSAENSVRINWIEHILVWGKDTIEWWPQWYVRKSISILFSWFWKLVVHRAVCHTSKNDIDVNDLMYSVTNWHFHVVLLLFLSRTFLFESCRFGNFFDGESCQILWHQPPSATSSPETRMIQRTE